MSDRYSTWLHEQIDAHAPENTQDADAAMRLAEACAALGGATASAFGMAVPADLADREAIRQKGIETLKRWIPKLDGEHVTRLKQMITTFRLGSS